MRVIVVFVEHALLVCRHPASLGEILWGEELVILPQPYAIAHALPDLGKDGHEALLYARVAVLQPVQIGDGLVWIVAVLLERLGGIRLDLRVQIGRLVLNPVDS